MRNWDQWNRYFDSYGNLLHGCIQFNVKDGDTVAPIYDRDGVSLANPQITDAYGRTEYQVFIDEDVTAYFYKYIGTGSLADEEEAGIDTSDTEKWTLQYTSDDTLDVAVDITTDSTISIGTMDDLRAVDPSTIAAIDGVKIITLLGYNEIGDKEPIEYVWNASSTAIDNGGSVIKSDDVLTGRWIMVQPTEHCDSRHFGAFPQNSYNSDDQTYQINALCTYCNSVGIRPFFNGDSNARWFIFTNLTVSINTALDVSDGTYFYDSGSNSITGEWNGNPYFYNGNTQIIADSVKNGWNASSYSGYSNVELNVDSDGEIWTNAHITGSGAITNGVFTSCSFDVFNTIGDGCSFSKCSLREQFFDDDTTTFGSLDSNTVDINDFVNRIDLWSALHVSDANLDYEGIAVTEDLPIGGIGAIASDRTFSNFIANGTSTLYEDTNASHTYTFNNCQGSIVLQGTAGNVYIFNDSNVDLTITNNANAFTIVATDSDIVLNQTLPYATLSITDGMLTLNDVTRIANLTLEESTVTGDSTEVTTSFVSFNSVLGVAISSPKMDVRKSTINAALTCYDNNGVINCSMIDNIFNAAQSLYGTTSDTVVVATWTNNVGNVEDPIVLDRSNIASADASHSYLYSNNSGTFVPSSEDTVTDTISIITDLDNYTGSEIYARMYDGDGIANSQWYQRGHLYTVRDNLSDPAPTLRFEMFRIGSDTFDVTCTWTPAAQATQATRDNTIPTELADWITLGGNTCVFSSVLGEDTFTWAPVPPSIPPYSGNVTSAYQLMLFGTIEAGNISGNTLSDLAPYTVNTIMTYKKV